MAQTAAQKRAAAAKKRRQRRDKREQYGFVVDFLRSNKEINALVSQAIKDGLTPSAFEARLKNTKWYRNRTEAQRQWDKNAYDDPGENARIQQRASLALSQAAKQAGVSFSKAELDTLSKKAARNGWTEAEFQAQVAAKVNITAATLGQTTLTGTVGQAFDDLRGIAAAYGVPVTATKLDAQIESIVAGNASAEDFTDHYRELAKAQYKSIAPMLDQGMTVMDVLDPYLQRAASDLGVSAAQIMKPGADGYMDPKWTKAIQGDAAMTLDEWQKYMRSDPTYGYSKTTKAKVAAASAGQRIAQLFGSA